eukprot:GILJ01004493.1.p1 GENE.GILJ01004493.1~~GILJ01004493.1.p1  ORF type:complete len:377 (-),score=56.90 GILJ01004493.1:274-1404(-)
MQSAVSYVSASIDGCRWSQAESASMSDEGSSGVFFVRMRGNSVVVVKGSQSIAEEFFAHQLCEKLNIPCPNTRLIQYTDDEYNRLKRCLRQLLSRDEGMAIKAERALDRPFFLVMEYVHGETFDSLIHAKPSFLLSPETELGQNNLRDLGRIAAFDLLINNWDRIPSVWPNEGNARNIMFGIKSGSVADLEPVPVEYQQLSDADVERGVLVGDVHQTDTLSTMPFRLFAVDSVVTCICNDTTVGAENEKNYTSKVSDFVSDLVSSFLQTSRPPPWAQAPFEGSVTRIQTFLQTVLLFDIGFNGCRLIAEGMLECIKSASILTSEDLTNIVQQCRQSVRRDWADVWTTGLDKIRIPFFIQIISVFKAALRLLEEAEA